MVKLVFGCNLKCTVTTPERWNVSLIRAYISRASVEVKFRIALMTSSTAAAAQVREKDPRLKDNPSGFQEHRHK